MEIKEGEVVVLLGPSGSGKSTFLRCLNRLEDITAGEVIVDGIHVDDKKTDINKLRENIGMVFQHFNLFPHMTVLENIMLAPVELKKMTKEEAREKGMALLKRVGLDAKADVYPPQLVRWTETACCDCACACNESGYHACLMSRPVRWIRRWLEKFWQS